MKTLKSLYGSLCVTAFLLGACAEDQGNYDYTDINEIVIENIEDTYTCELGAQLRIEPLIIQSLPGQASPACSWTIDGEEVSRNPVLDITLPPLDYGTHLCALTIHDENTGMQFRQTFNLSIVNPFNWGYYFLTEKDDHGTELGYIPAAENVEPSMDNMKYTTGIGNHTFGNKPSQLSGSFGYYKPTGDYAWTMTIMTEEGENPVIITDNYSFLPNTLVTAGSFVDQTKGYEFKPSQSATTLRQQQFFLSQGQHIAYADGKLNRPAVHRNDYHWSYMAASGLGNLFFWVFDDLTRQFYTIAPYDASDPSQGIYKDANAYDNVTEIQNNRPIEGKILAAAPSGRVEDCLVYTAADDGIHIYKLTRTFPQPASLESENIVALDGLGEQPAFAIGSTGPSANHWYVGKGNAIYYSSIEAPALNKWADLPADLGEVTSIGFSALGKRMVVTFYDSASPAERKGSVVFVDVETKKVTHTFAHSIHRCVSNLNVNSDGFGWGNYGDAL